MRKKNGFLILIVLLVLGVHAKTTEKKTRPGQILNTETRIQPGTLYYIDFPELGLTWHNKPARAGIYFPTDYTTDKHYPLFVWFGGGAGSDYPGRAMDITEGKEYICVALPYCSEENGRNGGWQTPWSYYETMLEQLETLVPNVDPRKRVCGGYSSGGAAIMYQLGNSAGAFQNYFHAFMPGGAGWPMGGLDRIKGRPMLVFVGEKDKRRPNLEKINEEASAAGVDITFLVLEDTAHKFPPACYPRLRQWLYENVTAR
ncbi:hypothetical protein [Pontiella agarivorans]|uniref:Esterase n=1 Tax=Pontiella agarivorans TaxID=3038953 RepID=A0ABU5MX07_9BACT|nr:hypothetical protein [Pontiella agarivorans]MDZ8118744.1 hypothetical protein [Pontiella agarivorans]